MIFASFYKIAAMHFNLNSSVQYEQTRFELRFLIF